MSLPQQITRKQMIKRAKEIGFTGPVRGGDHDFMVRDKLKLRLPNQHGQTLSRSGLKRSLHGAGISEKEWTGEE